MCPSPAAPSPDAAGSLADAGVPVILDPLDNLPRPFKTLHATLENPARLHAAGVRFAFATGSTHNARNLTQAAGNAVAHGLPPDAGAPAKATKLASRTAISCA